MVDARSCRAAWCCLLVAAAGCARSDSAADSLQAPRSSDAPGGGVAWELAAQPLDDAWLERLAAEEDLASLTFATFAAELPREDLTQLKGLRTLVVSEEPLADDDLDWIVALPALTDFRAPAALFSDAGVARLLDESPKLERLVLGASQLTGVGVQSLADRGGLVSIILHDGAFEPGALAPLARADGLHSLYLVNCTCPVEDFDALERAIPHVHAP